MPQSQKAKIILVFFGVNRYIRVGDKCNVIKRFCFVFDFAKQAIQQKTFTVLSVKMREDISLNLKNAKLSVKKSTRGTIARVFMQL